MSDLEVLDRLVGLSGQDVVDIGCGGGALVRALSAGGARVIGVEVNEEQLAPALRVDDGGSGARYLIGRAQELPLEDASVDAAVFMRTLHHVPPGELLSALSEARRVLLFGGMTRGCHLILKAISSWYEGADGWRRHKIFGDIFFLAFGIPTVYAHGEFPAYDAEQTFVPCIEHAGS